MKIINRHSEWIVFLIGLILLGTMNPYNTGTSLCILEAIGFIYCPGEGLGHSISFFFRGDIIESFNSNLMGPFVVIGLSIRIISIWKNLLKKQSMDLKEEYNV